MGFNVGQFFRKSYDRVTASKWTKSFVLVSILQLIVIVALETNVLTRNFGFVKVLISKQDSGISCGLKPSIIRMQLILQENVVFMIFQIFQLWFCVDAVQKFEITVWLSSLEKRCPEVKLNPEYATHDFLLVAFLIIFAVIMAILCWRLYMEFGWSIYKKIGADVKIQKMYKTMLIFVMLIKLSLFFVLMSAIEKEFKIGMVIYLTLSTVALIDFILILKESVRDIANSWYFFIVFMSVAIIVSFITWLWGVFAFLNFVNEDVSKTNQQVFDERHTIEEEEEIS
ncbi:12835_t:CDS:2 [Entrophospora sp. SA101]|nr:12835_t:CDS:2 [Entrophospora sp. SA101]